MIVQFNGDITADALRAALSASDIILSSADSEGVHHAVRRDRSCARCDAPAVTLFDKEPVCVRHWRELDKI